MLLAILPTLFYCLLSLESSLRLCSLCAFALMDACHANFMLIAVGDELVEVFNGGTFAEADIIT